MLLSGWLHLVYFGLFLPLNHVLESRKLKAATAGGGPLPNRLRNFQLRSFVLVAMAAVSVAVARLTRIDLLPRHWPSALALAAGGATYAAMVAFMLPRWRRAVEKQLPIVHFFAPATPAERVWWVVVSLTAGIGEEITWRGVQVSLLMMLLVPYYGVAALLSAVSFSAAHLAQGWRSFPVFMAIALAFQFLAWIAGSLVVAMAVHVAYDVTAGLTYGRLRARATERVP